MDEKINESTLLGYREVQTSGGAVKVKMLPIRMFNFFSLNLGNEPALVELFTGMSSAEVDQLPVEDFERIIEVGMEINLPPFSRWGKRQREIANLIKELFAQETPIPDATSGANGVNA